MNFNAEIEIDLEKLKYNASTLKNTYSDYPYVFANVKNNAFGMGYGIINMLIQCGINYLFVSTLQEALAIRQRNQDVAILVNYEVPKEYIYDAIMNNIILTISSLEHLRAIDELKLKDKLTLHLLIDNGSNKIGLRTPEEVQTAMEIIDHNEYLHLEGVYTELTTYGVVDEDFYYEFNQFLRGVNILNNRQLIVHLNEPIMYHKKNAQVNGIRFDLSLLGIEENIDDGMLSNMRIKSIEKKFNDLEFPDIDLLLVFAINARIIGINKAFKGTLIGRNYIAREDMNLAIIPIGHKDGITKAIGTVVIDGKHCRVISDEIDYLIVESPSTAQIGDLVTVLNEESDIYTVIGQLRTNRFYLMSILNNNLTRVYINIEESVGLL